MTYIEQLKSLLITHFNFTEVSKHKVQLGLERHHYVEAMLTPSYGENTAFVWIGGSKIATGKDVMYEGDDGIRKLTNRVKRLLRDTKQKIQVDNDRTQGQADVATQYIAEIKALNIDGIEAYAPKKIGTGCDILVNGHKISFGTNLGAPKSESQHLFTSLVIGGTQHHISCQDAVKLVSILPRGNDTLS